MTATSKQKSSLPRLIVTAWLPLLAWMALIAYLSSQSNLPHPESSVLDLVLSSAAHVALFGVLSILAVRAFGESRRAWFAALWLTLIYGLLDEFHQYFVPGRTPDTLDVACDAAGAILALWAWLHLPERWKRRLLP
jgi:VanZ family protein